MNKILRVYLIIFLVVVCKGPIIIILVILSKLDKFNDLTGTSRQLGSIPM